MRVFGAAAAAAAATAMLTVAACSRFEQQFLTDYDLPESAYVEDAPYPRLAENEANVTPETARSERERGEATEAALQINLAEMTDRADRLGDASAGTAPLRARAAKVRQRASQLLE